MEDHVLQVLSNHKVNLHDEQKEVKKQKKLGVGSLSLLLSVIGILFYFTDLREPRMTLGELILQKLHLNISTVPVTLAIFAIASIIGMRNKDDLFSKSGRNIAHVFLIFAFVYLALSLIALALSLIFKIIIFF